MNPEKPNDRDRMIEFIAATVESMREQMATKSDLAGLATKLDLAQVEARVDRIEQQMATRSDLAQLEQRVTRKLDAGLTAVRGDIERVAVRMDGLDRSVSLRNTAIQAEVSRIRSVVYLVVKDQPDLVRLLGNEPAY